jgi:CelD/BcsL family acetyltransferase involved in cellulose biosynthesis
VRIHSDLATSAFDLPPLAPHTGPFSGRALLGAWWHRRGTGTLRLVEGAEALLPLHRVGNRLTFLGEADLTDYHSPLGTSPGEVSGLMSEYASTLEPGTELALDSLPAEAAEPLVAGLAAAGVDVAAVEHEVSAVLSLPGSFDEWLSLVGKKQRHEVRRKRRRFEEEAGPPRLLEATGPDAVAEFAAMHRRSSGEKGTFMTQEMEEFFDDVAAASGARIHTLVGGDDADPLAAAFGFEDPDGYYLYNSAYEPHASDASPGIVLVTELIRRAIDLRLPRFDFLKGDEVYKFRHGANRRPLYAVEAHVR